MAAEAPPWDWNTTRTTGSGWAIHPSQVGAPSSTGYNSIARGQIGRNVLPTRSLGGLRTLLAEAICSV